MVNLTKLENILDVHFDNADLLLQALVHRSYLNENPDFRVGHNERLEFLGDAILELVVTEYLYKNYENPEGELTSWRAALVNANNLAENALKIGLNDFILLSRGEAKDKGKARQYILANAFEAVIGAIYLDQGLKGAEEFIKDKLLPDLKLILERKSYRDAKSLFQELAQDKAGITPNYEVIKEWGPDHVKKFKIGVFLGEELIAEGEGGSKQEGEQKAAEAAIAKKQWQ